MKYRYFVNMKNEKNAPKKKIEKPIRLIELFAGIGSQTQALKNIGVEHEVVAISEIDKYCVKSYEAMHGQCNNLGDICKIERLPQADLWTYSFPCQDLSVAGKLAGIKEGTRSGLLYQVERLLGIANERNELPKYLLLENVKNLVSKRFKPDFDRWLEYLESLGYKNFWKVLNAKDYGIPQNRERVFCISILGEDSTFTFPEKQELKLKLKDLLEDEVDEKYYLSQKMINCFMSDGTGNHGLGTTIVEPNLKTKLCNKLVKEGKVKEGDVIRHSYSSNRLENGDKNLGRVENHEGLSPTLDTRCDCLGIVVNEENTKKYKNYITWRNKKGEEGDVINHSRPNTPIVKDGVAPTLTTRGDELGVAVVPLKRGYDCEVKSEQDDPKGVEVIGNYSKSKFGQTPIVNKNGIAPTVTENHGQVTAIAIKNNTKQGYLMAEEGDAVDISGRMKWHRGTVQEGISQTITTAGGDNVGVVVKDKSLFSETERQLFTEDGNIRRYIGSDKVDEFKEGQMATTSFPNGYGHGPRVHDESVSLNTLDKPCVKYNLRIRKLTPRECLRLMGWNDEQIDKIQASGVSHSQQYKQAGNGIVVQVLEEIFRNLFKAGAD